MLYWICDLCMVWAASHQSSFRFYVCVILKIFSPLLFVRLLSIHLKHSWSDRLLGCPSTTAAGWCSWYIMFTEPFHPIRDLFMDPSRWPAATVVCPWWVTPETAYDATCLVQIISCCLPLVIESCLMYSCSFSDQLSVSYNIMWSSSLFFFPEIIVYTWYANQRLSVCLPSIWFFCCPVLYFWILFITIPW